MVGAARFELTTPCAQGRCATRLRYAPFSHGNTGPMQAVPAHRPYTDFTRTRKLIGIAEEEMPNDCSRPKPKSPCTACGDFQHRKDGLARTDGVERMRNRTFHDLRNRTVGAHENHVERD